MPGVTDLTDCARQMAALERTLDCTIFALEDRDSIETFAPTPNEIVLHYDSEGVVDSGLMRRLQKLIHRAEKAGEEEKRRAAEAERKKVEAEAEEKRAETERKEEEAEAEQKRAEAEAGAGGAGEGDGEGGKAATPASMSGTESTTREDELDAEQNEQEKEPVKPEEQLMAERSGSLYGGRTDGNSGRAMTAAEALATSGAATGPGMAEVVKEEGRKEGRGEAAENGEEGAKNDEGNEKLEENVTEAVWRGAEPIGAEAGKLAARLLSRVKHTWEELGQFCAFKVGVTYIQRHIPKGS